jgi:hypothetical protein
MISDKRKLGRRARELLEAIAAVAGVFTVFRKRPRFSSDSSAC